MRRLLCLAALAALAPAAASAQTVVVDSSGVQPGMARVRARLNELRGGRTVQPIVILVPSRTSPGGRDGRDGVDGSPGPGLPGGLPGVRPPTTAPVAPAQPGAPARPGAPAAPARPVSLDPAQQARLAQIPVEVVREVERQIVETGLFRTSNVLFEFDRARILPFATQTLDVVGDVLRRYPAFVVEVGGHTDGVGTAAYNLALSERRAEAVRAYLVDRWGIAPERLSAVGYGKAHPVADNGNETGRAINRRVEFSVRSR